MSFCKINDRQINCQNKNFKKTVQQCAAKTNLKMLKKDQMLTCCISLSQNRKANIVHNGYGLAMWWNLKIVRPEPQPIKNTKDEVNKQKLNRITSAETAADSDKMPRLTTSCHHIAKPNVGCCFMSKC